MPQELVIVDASGTEHVFPAGMDPKKAAAIVRQAQPRPRPNDPRTGQPVIVPGEPGYVVPGSEPQEPGQGFPSAMLDAVGGAVTGAASVLNPINMITGAANAIQHPVDTMRGLVTAQRGQNDQANERFAHARTAHGLDRALSYVEGAGRRLAAYTPLVGPAAANAGEDIGSGDPARMGQGVGKGAALVFSASPTLQRAALAKVQGVMSNVARRGALRTMQPSEDILAMTGKTGPAAEDALSSAALDNGVLPGLVKKGSAKAGARMAELDADARAGLAGETGQAAVNPRAVLGRSTRSAMRESPYIGRQAGPGPASSSAGEIVRGTVESPRLANPTASNMFEVEQGTRTSVLGHAPSPASVVRRALSADMRSEIGRAAPSVADTMSEINRLSPVQEAYSRFSGDAIPAGGVPTIKGRIALSALNRLVGPVSQGLHRVGAASNAPGAMLPAALQRAIILSLMGRDDATAP